MDIIEILEKLDLGINQLLEKENKYINKRIE